MSTPKVPRFVSNWTKYNTFLQKQDAFLVDVFTRHQGKKAKYEYERVLVGLLHRYALNFRTIYRCWGDFLNNSKFKFPIYTLLRPLIADHLLMMYLLEEFKWLVPTDEKNNRDEWEVNETDFIKRYENISTTFFERLDSYLKKKGKEVRAIACGNAGFFIASTKHISRILSRRSGNTSSETEKSHACANGRPDQLWEAVCKKPLRLLLPPLAV